MGKKITPPRQARKTYYAELGRLMAAEKVWELKSSQFGKLTARDRYSIISKIPSREGYTTLQRDQIYRKGLELYDANELIRPVINLIASAIFSKGSPDITGKDQELVELANQLIEENRLNFHDLARDAEIAGDCFLYHTVEGKKVSIYALDPSMTEVILKDNNIRDITGYRVKTSPEVRLRPEQVDHLKFNATPTSQYGKSSIRHVIYWSDVLDSLFEKNWLRGAQYFGNPQMAITGVPGAYQATVQAQIESQNQRAGRTLILPPDTDVKTLDFSLQFPIGDIVGWVFRMISIATEIPITLLGTADAGSRGSAFFANPRFVLAVHPRREVWRLGLRAKFLQIFKELGKVGDEPVSRKDFDLGFLPIFDRDFQDIADIVGIYRDRGLISKKSSRELIGLDHSDEEEFMAEEPDEEPVQDPSADPVALLQGERHKRKKHEPAY